MTFRIVDIKKLPRGFMFKKLLYLFLMFISNTILASETSCKRDFHTWMKGESFFHEALPHSLTNEPPLTGELSEAVSNKDDDRAEYVSQPDIFIGNRARSSGDSNSHVGNELSNVENESERESQPDILIGNRARSSQSSNSYAAIILDRVENESHQGSPDTVGAQISGQTLANNADNDTVAAADTILQPKPKVKSSSCWC